MSNGQWKLFPCPAQPQAMLPIVKDSGDAMQVPVKPEAYAHVREIQQVWLAGSRPLPDKCPRYPTIRIMLVIVMSPVIAHRIGRRRKNTETEWRNGAALHQLERCGDAHIDFSFNVAWSRKKIKAPHSRKPGLPLMYGTICIQQLTIGLDWSGQDMWKRYC